jgi:hypothetical protein
MKKTLCLFFGLFLFAATLNGQVDSAYNEPAVFKNSFILRVSYYYANFGILSLPNMQQVLKSGQINTSGNFGFVQSLPFELGWRYQDWFFNMNISLPLASTYRSNKDNFNKRFTFGSLTLERSVFKSHNYRVNAFLGAGYYEYAFSYGRSEANRQVATPDLFTSNFAVSPELYNQGGMLNFGVSLLNQERKRVSIGTCIRAGYCLGFDTYAWKARTVSIVNAPRDRLGLFYLQALLSISRNR